MLQVNCFFWCENIAWISPNSARILSILQILNIAIFGILREYRCYYHFCLNIYIAILFCKPKHRSCTCLNTSDYAYKSEFMIRVTFTIYLRKNHRKMQIYTWSLIRRNGRKHLILVHIWRSSVCTLSFCIMLKSTDEARVSLNTQVCLDNSDTCNSDPAITLALFGHKNRVCRLKCAWITRIPE